MTERRETERLTEGRSDRENWMMIREHRSGCRSVEAAWGGSDTKTALVQTDKHVCLPSMGSYLTKHGLFIKQECTIMYPSC